MWKTAEDFLMLDKYIGPLVVRYGKCTLKPRPRKYYFEDLVDAIVQQQLSMKAASSIFNRLKEKVADNKSIPRDSKHKWRADLTKEVFLTPEKLLALSAETFRQCGLSRAKTEYVKDLSLKVVNGEVKINNMANLDDPEIIKELTQVKGIGVWTSHMFLMFTLNRPDIFPVGDLGLRNAFKKVTGKDLDVKKTEKFAERWKPYRTIASWYIWKSLEE